MRYRFSSVLALVLLALPAAASAQAVASRSMLDLLLGGARYTEGFEAFTVAAGTSEGRTLSALDASTSVSGFGTGMVRPDLRFESAAPEMQIAGAGYYGQASNALTFYETFGGAQHTDVRFENRVSAVGLDLSNYDGWSDDATVSVFGAGGTLLHSQTLGVSGSTPVFFGWQDANGIESVRIQGTHNYWTPLIDNVSYGTAFGEVISSRSTLNAVLGADGVTEGFETFSVATGTSEGRTLSALDASTNVAGYGTAMVRNDIRFQSTATEMQIAGAGYYGQTSNALTFYETFGGAQHTDIRFDRVVDAFGLDLSNYDGWSDQATVSVFGAGDALIHRTTLDVNGSTPVFFGLEYQGIERVLVEGTHNYWAPLIDNVTYGSVFGEVVGSRTALESVIGNDAITEGFESFAVATGTSEGRTLSALDGSTNVAGYGTGMVRPEFRFESTATEMQIAGEGYYGQASNALTFYETFGGPQHTDIFFAGAVNAFGLDLSNYDGWSDVATVSIFGAGDQLLGEQEVAVSGSGAVFFGWQDERAIERVRVAGRDNYWVPLIDNVTIGSPFGDVVSSRAALAVLLGDGMRVEGFESFAVATGTSEGRTLSALDASTDVPGYGTGMVRPDVRFESTATEMQIAGEGYYGQLSNALTFYETFGGAQHTDIVFQSAVDAFGLDLSNYDGWSDLATVSVFGAGGTLLFETALNVAGSAPVFFGWEDERGIESVRVAGRDNYWAPLIDDVAYGQLAGAGPGPDPTTVPEPMSMLLLGSGLAGIGVVRRRRRGSAA